MTSLSLNSARPGCRAGGVGITPALLSAGLPVDPVLCVRPVFTAFPRSPPQPFRWCSVGRLPLSPHLSLSLFSSLQGRPFPRGAGQRGGRRDVLQQGKPVAAGHSVAWMHCRVSSWPFGEMRIVSEYFVFFFYRREHGSRTRTISGSAE